MTESVTPPDPPLVDPETGETAPLSPRPLTYRVTEKLTITQAYDRSRSVVLGQFLDAAMLSPEKRQAYLYGEWDEYETTLATHLESDDGA